MPETREMRWERLTGPEVAALADETNVALIPVGCVETHGPHLPTGTDGFHALAVCQRAAAIEPAIITPTIFFNINDEMLEYQGVIHVSVDTLKKLYHDLCMSCARNGFRRVIFMASHGGSMPPIDWLLADALERRHDTGRWDYFPTHVFITNLMKTETQELFPGISDGHGGPIETSWVMAARPGLVHIDRVDRPGPVLKRSIPGLRPRVPWNRLVPLGYTGDPRPADPEKGRIMLDAAGARLAEIIAKIKKFDPDADI